MEKLKIGVFDSGFGGLTLLPELNLLNRDVEIYYIADSANAPYGNKSFDFIEARCVELSNELLKETVDVILVACNTATAHAVATLRKELSLPIVGIEPFLNFLNLNNKEDVKLGVITTEATLESIKFNELRNRVDPEMDIEYLACPNLAEEIEKSMSVPEQIDSIVIANELTPLKGKGLTHLILGCTHYPLVKSAIENYLSVDCINPSLPITKRIAELFETDISNAVPEDFSFYFRQSTEQQWELKNYSDYICS